MKSLNTPIYWTVRQVQGINWKGCCLFQHLQFHRMLRLQTHLEQHINLLTHYLVGLDSNQNINDFLSILFNFTNGSEMKIQYSLSNKGETYECVREDRGFRYVSEQVSHHPPVSTCHAFSEDGSWRWWQDFRVKTKFWGKVNRCKYRQKK